MSKKYQSNESFLNVLFLSSYFPSETTLKSADKAQSLDGQGITFQLIVG